MTRDQKKLLESHAAYFQAMAAFVRDCSDKELHDLRAACAAATQTNCGWDTFAAAQWLTPEIRSEQYRRAEAASLCTERTQGTRT